MTKQVDYLIIGGGPAGTKAAESIRQDDPRGRILIVTKEPYRLYDRTKLPAYIKGDKSRDEIFMRSEQQYRDQQIELQTGSEVTGMDPVSRRATLSDGQEIAFHKALISSGGSPAAWDVPGSDKTGLVRLNTLDDAEAIIGLLSSTDDMVIVGGGFISLEFCGIAAAHNKKATVLVREPYYWANILDEVSGRLITKFLEQNGIIVRVGEEVAEVMGDEGVTGIKTTTGETIPAQMVGVGIGVKRNLDFLEGTQIKIENGIVTDEFLESSVGNIWAAGDVAKFNDIVLGMSHVMGNWSNASDQGIYVGHIMALAGQAGNRKPFEAVSSYSITAFNFHVAFVGDPKPEGVKVIERGDKDHNFGRIFIKEDRVVGATLIARPLDRAPLKELIRQKTAVDARLRAQLSDHTKPIPMPRISDKQ